MSVPRAASIVLVSGNSDANVDSKLVDIVRGKVVHWFAQNLKVKEPWISAIPIGLENLRYRWHGETAAFRKLRKKHSKTVKVQQILFGFTVNNNRTERENALRSLRKCSLANELPKGLTPATYRKWLTQYGFVASPEGNGLDCHRTWEAMYLNVVPIVKRSIMAEAFFGEGFPLWIIDDWKELETLSEKELTDKYSQLKGRFGTEKLWMPYWISQMKNKLVTVRD